VLPAANDGYQRSLHGEAVAQLGTTVKEVWSRLLRHPNRFVPIESGVFLDPLITSAEYIDRYGERS
jgi:hypothetical protein